MKCVRISVQKSDKQKTLAELCEKKDAEIMRLRARNSELKESLRDVVSDYINFDDGHLTVSIFIEAAELIERETI